MHQNSQNFDSNIHFRPSELFGGGLGGLKRFLGESRGFFGSESVGFFSKCLILVHLTLLGWPVSQILTLTNYHNTLNMGTSAKSVHLYVSKNATLGTLMKTL